MLEVLLLVLRSVAPTRSDGLRVLVTSLGRGFTRPVGGSGQGILVFATFTSATSCLCRRLTREVGTSYKLGITLVANDARNGYAVPGFRYAFGGMLAFFSPVSGSGNSVFSRGSYTGGP